MFVQPNAIFTKLVSACGFDQDGTGYHCSWCLVFPVTGQGVCLNLALYACAYGSTGDVQGILCGDMRAGNTMWSFCSVGLQSLYDCEEIFWPSFVVLIHFFLSPLIFFILSIDIMHLFMSRIPMV